MYSIFLSLTNYNKLEMSASNSVSSESSSAACMSKSTCKSVRTDDVDELFVSPAGSKLSLKTEEETNKFVAKNCPTF